MKRLIYGFITAIPASLYHKYQIEHIRKEEASKISLEHIVCTLNNMHYINDPLYNAFIDCDRIYIDKDPFKLIFYKDNIEIYQWYYDGFYTFKIINHLNNLRGFKNNMEDSYIRI